VPPATLPAIPERIVIEKIGLNVPIVPVGQHPIRIAGQTYSQWNVPDERVAGWHENSAPLGVRGNTVLNGHHNVNGAVFHYLAVLEPGDMITLESGGEQHLYVIAQMMVLAEEGQPLATRRANARWILPTTDERVTLITCWPLEASTHRLVVIALSTGALDQLTGIP
jgi:sortase A